MSSSSGDDYHSYRHIFPLHDAAEAGDMETLMRILRPAPSRKAVETPLVAHGEGDFGAFGMAGHGLRSPEKLGRQSQEGHVGDDAGTPLTSASPAGAGGAEDDYEDEDDEPGAPYRFRIDLDERDAEGATPLHVALSHKRLTAARLLLEAGAGTGKKMEGSTPGHIALSVASVRRHRDFADAALKLLLEHNFDISAKDDRGQTLLHLAAGFGLDDALRTILSAPGGTQLLDVKERLHCRPLHLAALGGHVGATEALIEAGCDTMVTSLHGNTALHLACLKGRWDVARLLLDKGGSDWNVRNKSKQTPGELACKQGFHVPETLPELSPSTAAQGGNGVVDMVVSVGSDWERERGGASPSRGERGQRSSPDVTGSSARSPAGVPASRVEGAERAKTVVFTHPSCLQHFSCPPITRSSGEPPPENVKRLEVIYNEDSGVLRADEFASLDWEQNPNRAQLCDVLRVHEYAYVEKLERLCSNIPDSPRELRHLDGDTAVSRSSFEAAMRAAGAVCDAVDRVISGRNRNAFCAVRPPGHHAGPRGLVTCGNDAQGSHGFCLLNNVFQVQSNLQFKASPVQMKGTTKAIGAAYARCVHRHAGIDRVAIVDFDVHHGNGTEDIVRATVPRSDEAKISAPFCSGILHQVQYKPWLNAEDPDKCLFISVHGYGKKERHYHNLPGGWFYPGSGQTRDCRIIVHSEAGAEGGSGDGQRAGEQEGVGAGELRGGSGVNGGLVREKAVHRGGNGVPGKKARGPIVPGIGVTLVEDPLIINVGMPLPDNDDTPGASRHRWRDVYRKHILPKLAAFRPDIIMVSAGFDAHKKDSINFGYIGLLEEDYEWITQQLVQVANKCCNGRIVSVLEGGYRVQGGIVSAFGRSVAGHVRALMDGCQSRQEWSAADAAWESNFEQRLLQERERKRKHRIEQQMQAIKDREYKLRLNMLQQEHQQEQQEQREEQRQPQQPPPPLQHQEPPPSPQGLQQEQQEPPPSQQLQQHHQPQARAQDPQSSHQQQHEETTTPQRHEEPRTSSQQQEPPPSSQQQQRQVGDGDREGRRSPPEGEERQLRAGDRDGVEAGEEDGDREGGKPGKRHTPARGPHDSRHRSGPDDEGAEVIKVASNGNLHSHHDDLEQSAAAPSATTPGAHGNRSEADHQSLSAVGSCEGTANKAAAAVGAHSTDAVTSMSGAAGNAGDEGPGVAVEGTSVSATVAETQGEGDASVPPGTEGDEELPRKRRRTQVNYIALQQKLQAEAKSRKVQQGVPMVDAEQTIHLAEGHPDA